MKEVNKEALTYAFNLLSISDRSEGMLLEKLLKRFDNTQVSGVIEYLKTNNFIDDVKFAKNLVENYSTVRHYGKNRIKVELIKKKIPNDIISKELEEIINEDTSCTAMAQSWTRKKHLSGEIDYATRNKLLAFLMRRGFDYETAKDSATEALNNID